MAADGTRPSVRGKRVARAAGAERDLERTDVRDEAARPQTEAAVARRRPTQRFADGDGRAASDRTGGRNVRSGASPAAARATGARPRPTSRSYLASQTVPQPRNLRLLVAGVLAALLFAGMIWGIATNRFAAEDEPDAAPVDVQEQADSSAGAAAAAEPISVATGGDIIFARGVWDYIDEAGGAAPMAEVAPILAAADVAIANLEAPLSYDTSEALTEKDVILLSHPDGIASLTASGFEFLSLANNHIMDYGEPGLSDTLAALDGAGIRHAGAGMNDAEAWQAAEIDVKGSSIAFLSFSDILPEDFVAYAQSPGVAAGRLDIDAVCEAVRQAKAGHDYVIVAMHWGVEYEDYINEMQDEHGHALVDAGADVVLGNHPHVIQGIESYHGALIVYSQGDFVFDHYQQVTGETFILQFTLGPDGIGDIVATPVYLDDDTGVPRVVTGDEASSILERLEQISVGMNTAFDLRDDKAYIRAVQ